jgi:hypothetical protein
MRRIDAGRPRFHFAFPRLCTRFGGGDATAVETNWAEANIVGAAVMLISYLALRGWIVRGAASISRELLFVVPLVLTTWIFWLVALYLDSLVLRLLRAIGLLSRASNADAQSVMVAMITTAFAVQLTGERGWPHLLGWLWIAAVCANLLAAMLLALTSRARDGR